MLSDSLIASQSEKWTRIPFKLEWLLALLCNTAQQRYCRHAGVRRPSVKPIFSETVVHTNTKFCGYVPANNISRPYFVLFFKHFNFWFYTKFGWTPMKFVGGIETSSCIWSCVKKISKCHNFWQIAKKVTACMIMIPCIKVWMNQIKIGRGAEV